MTTPVTYTDLAYMWQQVIMPRCGDVYVYGGSLDPNDVTVGTDCSGAVSEVNEALLYGPGMNWARQFYTGTFAGANPGDTGPFGGVEDTSQWVCIPAPDQQPPGAVMTVAVLQLSDPEDAHMVCAALDPLNLTGFNPTLDPGAYIGIESGGSYTDANGNSTLHIGPEATGVNNPMFNQWFALNATLTGVPGVPPPTPPPLTKTQQYALTIVQTGQSMGITPLGCQMALACVYDESSFLMYANSNVPESLNYPYDAVGSNGESCGLFQQQAQYGWGTVQCEMDVACSAGLFFTALAKLDYNSGNQPPWMYIQDVQNSATADGSNYQAQWGNAVDLYNQVISLSPAPTPTPSPTPVSWNYPLYGPYAGIGLPTDDATIYTASAAIASQFV